LSNQVPREFEFEELTKNIDHTIASIGVVLEMELGFDPVEELERALPIVAVGGEGLANSSGV
jgi:hypothetical protein